MAIEIEIPKDITKYEAKLIGPLTTRQTLCFVPAAAIAITIFVSLKEVLSQDIRVILIFLCAAPLLLLGWYKPYGLPLEKFIKTAFTSVVLSPKNRKYMTVNAFEELEKGDNAKISNKKNESPTDSKSKSKPKSKSKSKSKQRKSNPDFIAYS